MQRCGSCQRHKGTARRGVRSELLVKLASCCTITENPNEGTRGQVCEARARASRCHRHGGFVHNGT